MYYLRFPYSIWGGPSARQIALFVTFQPQPQNYENICSSKALPYQKVNKKYMLIYEISGRKCDGILPIKTNARIKKK